MARLTLDIPDDTHRKLKTLAAYLGMTMKDFLISRALSPADHKAGPNSVPAVFDEASRLDNLLFQKSSFQLSPENWDAFCTELKSPANPDPALQKLMSTPSVLDER